MTVDLCPDLDETALAARLAGQGKDSLTTHLRKRLRLPPVSLALAQELGRPLPRDPAALAATLKALSVRTGASRRWTARFPPPGAWRLARWMTG